MTGAVAGDRPAFRPGQRLRVVDDSPFTGPKGARVKPPFAAGAEVECLRASPTSVLIKGDDRFWKAARFTAA